MQSLGKKTASKLQKSNTAMTRMPHALCFWQLNLKLKQEHHRFPASTQKKHWMRVTGQPWHEATALALLCKTLFSISGMSKCFTQICMAELLVLLSKRLHFRACLHTLHRCVPITAAETRLPTLCIFPHSPKTHPSSSAWLELTRQYATKWTHKRLRASTYTHSHRHTGKNNLPSACN